MDVGKGREQDAVALPPCFYHTKLPTWMLVLRICREHKFCPSALVHSFTLTLTKEPKRTNQDKIVWNNFEQPQAGFSKIQGGIL